MAIRVNDVALENHPHTQPTTARFIRSERRWQKATRGGHWSDSAFLIHVNVYFRSSLRFKDFDL
jgi:hypothetical protein